MVALAVVEVVLAAVILAYEVIAGRLSWPPALFLVAAIFILVVDRRRRPTARR